MVGLISTKELLTTQKQVHEKNLIVAENTKVRRLARSSKIPATRDYWFAYRHATDQSRLTSRIRSAPEACTWLTTHSQPDTLVYRFSTT